jgi:hypothetical protein
MDITLPPFLLTRITVNNRLVLTTNPTIPAHGNGHPPPYISTNNAEISRFSGEISFSDPDCSLLELHGPEFHLFVVFQ